MVDDDGVAHRATTEQVLLDDPLEHRGIAAAIPRALRVDDGDRPTLAHAEAVHLRPEDTTALGQTELLEPALQVVPSNQPTRLLATLGVGLITTEQDVTGGNVNTHCRRDAALALKAPAVNR